MKKLILVACCISLLSGCVSGYPCKFRHSNTDVIVENTEFGVVVQVYSKRLPDGSYANEDLSEIFKAAKEKCSQ